MTAEWRLTEGFSANVLALLSGTHDSEGHWAGPWSQAGRVPQYLRHHISPVGLEKEWRTIHGGYVALLDWKHASPPSPCQLGNGFCLGGHKSFRARAFLWVSKATWAAQTQAPGLHWELQRKWRNGTKCELTRLWSKEPGQNPALSLIKKSA